MVWERKLVSDLKNPTGTHYGAISKHWSQIRDYSGKGGTFSLQGVRVRAEDLLWGLYNERGVTGGHTEKNPPLKLAS